MGSFCLSFQHGFGVNMFVRHGCQIAYVSIIYGLYMVTAPLNDYEVATFIPNRSRSKGHTAIAYFHQPYSASFVRYNQGCN